MEFLIVHKYQLYSLAALLSLYIIVLYVGLKKLKTPKLPFNLKFNPSKDDECSICNYLIEEHIYNICYCCKKNNIGHQYIIDIDFVFSHRTQDFVTNYITYSLDGNRRFICNDCLTNEAVRIKKKNIITGVSIILIILSCWIGYISLDIFSNFANNFYVKLILVLSIILACAYPIIHDEIKEVDLSESGWKVVETKILKEESIVKYFDQCLIDLPQHCKGNIKDPFYRPVGSCRVENEKEKPTEKFEYINSPF